MAGDVDQGRDQDEYWKPVFDAYEWVKDFQRREDPDVVILCYNDHASAMMRAGGRSPEGQRSIRGKK